MQSNRKDIILLTTLLLLLVLRTAAADAVYRNIGTSEGLSGLLVNTIVKDPVGYVWLGTDNGLDRFDGIRLRHYGFSGTNNPEKLRVNAVAFNGSDVWVGNAIGLWQKNATADILERFMPEKINAAVNCIVPLNGKLYLGTARGLYIVAGKNVQTLAPSADRWSGINRIHDICREGQTLWLATEKGICAFDTRSRRFTPYYIEQGRDNYVKCMTIIGHTLYLGTMTQGLVKFDTRSRHFEYNTIKAGTGVISDLATDGKDIVYVATDGDGVYYLSHTRQQIIKTVKATGTAGTGLSSNSVYSLMVDNRGMLWTGTYRNGLDYTLFQNSIFHTYTLPGVFSTQNINVNKFYINGDSKLIGTHDGLFYINEATRRVEHFAQPRLSSDIILSIGLWKRKFYIGTYGGGLMTLDAATMSLQRYPAAEKVFSNGHIFCIKTDKAQNLWLGTSDGIWRIDPMTGTRTHFSTTNSKLPAGNVYDITFDSRGRGWIGTDNGLAIYDPQTATIHDDAFPDGFISKEKVRCIYEDSRHMLYFIREKGPLFRSNLTMTDFGEMPVAIMRPGGEVSLMAITEDSRNNIWLASSDGLFRGNLTDNDNYAIFGTNDGLPGPTFTNNSIYIGPDGTLWLGNTKGLVWARLSDVEKRNNGNGMKIVISEVQANDEYISEGQTVEHDHNNVTFRFSNLLFGRPNADIYEYKLEGKDENWQLATSKSEVEYFGLPSGRYTFKVRVPGNAATEASFSFRIAPVVAWWGWLFILMAAGCVAYIFFAERRYIKSQQEAAEKITEADTAAAAGAEQPVQTQHEHQPRAALLTDAECEELKRRIEKLMKKERPYVNKNLKMADVAAQLQTTTNAVSYVLNQYMQKSYNDFINAYRVEEFKRLVDSGASERYTLTALYEQCGFGSQASFFRIFKKFTGITPSEYLKKR